MHNLQRLDIILKRREVTFTFLRSDGVSLQRREIGPTQVCAFHHGGWYTLDRENKQLGEEKFSLSLSLSTSSQRQSVRQRFSCVSLPSMNVTMWVCARGASNTREVKLGNCSRAGCWRAAPARRCKVCVSVCVHWPLTEVLQGWASALWGRAHRVCGGKQRLSRAHLCFNPWTSHTGLVTD